MGSIHKSPSDARLATPDGKHATDAEGTQAMEMDMSLTGSAQVRSQCVQPRRLQLMQSFQSVCVMLRLLLNQLPLVN